MTTLREIGEQAFEEGRNVAETLRAHLGVEENTPEILEIAYDLQAGTYVQFADDNPDHVRRYAAQLAEKLDPHLAEGDSLLDVGTGELTNLSHLVAGLGKAPGRVYACDISERRLRIGRDYANRHMGPAVERLELFRAELSSIPLPDKSVDVVTSNHALEPNGGRETELLAELFRLARKKLVLFEPCFEIASPEARQRMQHHGYISGLGAAAARLGAAVEGVTPLSMVDNALNPTACFVIVPPSS